MSDGAILVHPRRLLEALDNAVLFSKDLKGNEVNDTIRIAWNGDTLRFMGRGRYSAGLHEMTPIRVDGEVAPWDLIIDDQDADEISSALKGKDVPKLKDSAVSLLAMDDRVAIHQGTHVIGVLQQVEEHHEYRSTPEYEGVYEFIERVFDMPTQQDAPVSQLVWTRGVAKKVMAVKLGTGHKDYDRFALEYLGGASWVWRLHSEEHNASFTAAMESTRDNLE